MGSESRGCHNCRHLRRKRIDEEVISWDLARSVYYCDVDKQLLAVVQDGSCRLKGEELKKHFNDHIKHISDYCSLYYPSVFVRIANFTRKIRNLWPASRRPTC